MRTIAFVLMSSLLASLAPGPTWAEGLDCGKYVRGAQQAIDKVSDDMKGMQDMPRDELVQVHTLLADARMFLDAARESCDRSESDFGQARAIAKAEAARGSAEAADVLHVHLRKNFAGMRDASGVKGRADAASTDKATRR